MTVHLTARGQCAECHASVPQDMYAPEHLSGPADKDTVCPYCYNTGDPHYNEKTFTRRWHNNQLWEDMQPDEVLD